MMFKYHIILGTTTSMNREKWVTVTYNYVWVKCKAYAPVICIHGPLGAGETGDLGGLSAGISPPMCPGSAVDVAGF